MANYATLKAAVADVVKTNGSQAITGANLQAVLLSIINSIGANYTFVGVATPSTSAGTPDQNVYYIGGAGTYSNFGTSSYTVPSGAVGVFLYNGSWSCEQVTVENGGVFDISAFNAVGGTLATYSDLVTALGTNGANIPVGVRKGGMSIKFVQSSDNKYIQARCMADEFTTDTTQWTIADEGVYVESPEFVYVKTDAEGRILWAIKTDGGIYYGAGCPQQVIDYIEEKIADLSLDEYEDIVVFLSDYLGSDTTLKVMIDGINAQIATKLDAEGLDHEALETVQAVENPEWISVTTDSDDNILEGITAEGVKQINLPIDTPTSIIDYTDDSDWIDLKTDKESRILEGINSKGEKIFGVLPPQIKEYIDTLVGKTGTVTIHNPYEDISNKVRHRAISHEHITNQEKLERAVNDGIDVFCISNYSPGVPVYELTQDPENPNKYGYSREYVDWEFVKGQNDELLYEHWGDGTIKTITYKDGSVYKVPQLRKATRTLTRSYSNFTKEDGDNCDLSTLVMLPNAEHSNYSLDRVNGLFVPHTCIIGTTWCDAVNSADDDTAYHNGLSQYNSENGYKVRTNLFHNLFPLWSLHEMTAQSQHYAKYTNKLFGTINHPGFTGLKDWHVDELITRWPNLYRAMEIYNNSDNQRWADYNIRFYDRTLMRGYKLWCVAVDDWGAPVDSDTGYPERRGCNLLYLPSSYENQTLETKARMALDAYIKGSFSACGYGKIDISSIVIDNNKISITFNQVPDSTIIDIDGNRTNAGSNITLEVEVSSSNKFVRFEAYKDDDFIFTQPFFIN